MRDESKHYMQNLFYFYHEYYVRILQLSNMNQCDMSWGELYHNGLGIYAIQRMHMPTVCQEME